MHLEVPGCSVYYEVTGDSGLPVVMLWNGAWCSLRMWDPVLEQLSDQFRFVTMDTRGVGQSDATEVPELEYTLDTYSNDAVQLLDELGIEQCHVCGQAWGARAAMAFAGLNTSRVQSLLLFDASIDKADVEAQKAGHEIAMERQRATGMVDFPLPKGWNVHKHPAEVPLALAAIRAFDLAENLQQLTMPVLIATGDCDPNLASSRKIADQLSHAELKVLQNVGHGSVRQRPDLAIGLMSSFFGSDT